MKHERLLHPQLARVVASLGHGQLLGIGDAGLPIPPSVERIDLAYAPGRPPFLDVVGAILAELEVEAYIVADEARESGAKTYVDALAEQLPEAEAVWVSHEELKRELARAIAVVRTGEFTPYANVILRSGVRFPGSAS